MLRKFVMTVAIAGGLIAVPALPSSAAPSGGCPYPPHRPQLTIGAAPSTILAGQTADVFGSFKQNNCGIHNGQIHVQSRPVVNGKASGSWKTFRVSTTDSHGLWAAAFAPTHNAVVRAFFVASGKYPTTFSSTVPLSVRPYLSIGGKNFNSCKVQLTGKTSPAKPNRRIFVRNRGPKNHFTGWKTLWETRTDSKGRYSTTHKLACGSTYNLGTYIAHDATNLAEGSKTIYNVKTAPVAHGFPTSR